MPRTSPTKTPIARRHDQWTYFLPQHVFVCSTTRYVVILDLIADKYICVQRRVLDGLAPCLSGWIPLPGKVAESSTSHTDGANVIETLLAEGILTKGRADAKPVAPAPIAVANAALAPVSKQARSVILFRYLRSFVMACVSADRALRKQPLASVVAQPPRDDCSMTAARKASTWKPRASWLQHSMDCDGGIRARMSACLIRLHCLNSWRITAYIPSGSSGDPRTISSALLVAGRRARTQRLS